MSKEHNLINRKANWLRLVGGTLAFAGTLALAGCGGGKGNTAVDTTSPLPTNRDVPADPNAPISGQHTITFDDLGGGSSIIEVFPGIQDTPEDKTFNGTYRNGDVVQAICKAVGRPVHSDPSVGEEARSSNAWVRIVGTPGETQYATSVYIQNPQQALSSLPDC